MLSASRYPEPCSPPREGRDLRDERGAVLIEVLVSSVLLVVIALAVYTGVDGASATSGLNKARSVASSLAQKDLDRVRALQLSELTNLNQTNPVVTGGVPYTVVSRGEWVDDASGTVGNACATTGGNTDYVKITSTVTWPRMAPLQPVTVASLVPVTASSYGGKGNLAVRINRQDGTPVAGQSTSLTGAGTSSAVTSALGCAFYEFLAAGNYTLSFSRAGYVDPSGASSISVPTTVNPGGTATKALLYDQAGQINATFDTSRAGLTAGTNVISPAKGAAVHSPPAGETPSANPNTSTHVSVKRNTSAPSSAPAKSTWTVTTGEAAAVPTTSVFYPFPTAYGLFAGSCASNEPGVVYGTATPLGTALVTPGASPANAVVRVPALNIKVTSDAGGTTPVAGARVRVTPTSSGCETGTTAPVAVTQVTTAANATTDTPAGALPSPGMPWGRYSVCAQRLVGSTTRRTTVANIDNTAAVGSTVRTIAITSSSTSGTCP